MSSIFKFRLKIGSFLKQSVASTLLAAVLLGPAILGLQFASSPSVWAGDQQKSHEEPPALHLPPLNTEEEKVGFLIWLRDKMPRLFIESATYDVDLFSI